MSFTKAHDFRSQTGQGILENDRKRLGRKKMRTGTYLIVLSGGHWKVQLRASLTVRISIIQICSSPFRT